MSVIQLINRTNILSVITIVILAGLSSKVSAKDYMVEVVLFKNTAESRATESHNYTAPHELKTGSETWELEPSMLLEQIDALEVSDKYEVRHHFSWGQESLPYEDSATFEVFATDAQGFIKIYAEQLLFANIDLDFEGYRMQEKRRLKLNEKHYFDHPKFGILLQVSRLEPEEDLEGELIEQSDDELRDDPAP
jgi:hypothetical protein